MEEPTSSFAGVLVSSLACYIVALGRGPKMIQNVWEHGARCCVQRDVMCLWRFLSALTDSEHDGHGIEVSFWMSWSLAPAQPSCRHDLQVQASTLPVLVLGFFDLLVGRLHDWHLARHEDCSLWPLRARAIEVCYKNAVPYSTNHQSIHTYKRICVKLELTQLLKWSVCREFKVFESFCVGVFALEPLLLHTDWHQIDMLPRLVYKNLANTEDEVEQWHHTIHDK